MNYLDSSTCGQQHFFNNVKHDSYLNVHLDIGFSFIILVRIIWNSGVCCTGALRAIEHKYDM